MAGVAGTMFSILDSEPAMTKSTSLPVERIPQRTTKDTDEFGWFRGFHPPTQINLCTYDRNDEKGKRWSVSTVWFIDHSIPRGQEPVGEIWDVVFRGCEILRKRTAAASYWLQPDDNPQHKREVFVRDEGDSGHTMVFDGRMVNGQRLPFANVYLGISY